MDRRSLIKKTGIAGVLDKRTKFQCNCYEFQRIAFVYRVVLFFHANYLSRYLAFIICKSSNFFFVKLI